jgi:hypothetical protein
MPMNPDEIEEVHDIHGGMVLASLVVVASLGFLLGAAIGVLLS